MKSSMQLILASFGLTIAATSAEYCPCFTKTDLETITQDNYLDILSSCHESHSTGSGIGIFSTEENEHGPLGYHVSLNSAMPLCTMGSANMLMNTGNFEQAEVCAELIRNRCMEVAHNPIEI
jgi:hypothetical protein